MTNKKVLITGASRGLGLAIAKKLSSNYQLVLHATRESSFSEVISNSQLLCADFSDPAAVADFCKRLKKEHGDELFAVINNAGIVRDNGLLFQPEAEIDELIQVNLKAPIVISKAALKMFTRKKAGTIINMSSIVGEQGNAFQTVYSATKAGIAAFSKSLAQEVGVLNEAHEIRVLCVSPGFIETEMTAKMPLEEQDKFLKRISTNRLGKPQDVANLVDFLLSDQASYINGSTIQINGGMC